MNSLLSSTIIALLVVLQGIGGTAGIGGSAGLGGGASAPTTPSVLASAFCVSNVSGTTTTSINTTGANLIVETLGTDSSTIGNLTDNKSNGNATKLTSHQNSSSGTSTIAYWSNPTVGTGHTFTFPGGHLAGACIIPIANASIFDTGTDNGANGTTTCIPGSITPGSSHIAITSVSGSANSAPNAPTINASFTIVGFAIGVGGTSYSNSGAYLVTGAGAANPTWNGASSTQAACSIASFH